MFDVRCSFPPLRFSPRLSVSQHFSISAFQLFSFSAFQLFSIYSISFSDGLRILTAIERLDELHVGATPVEEGSPHERPHKPLLLLADFELIV
jgi:hypothetical protein